MKHAIIVTGGKQYRVAEGDVIFIEKLNVEGGDAVTFDQVLAVIDENGSKFGAPMLEGAMFQPASSRTARLPKSAYSR